jgi:histidine triad (HIT) family protein
MPYDDQNIFARILRDEIPCERVYEDGYALAFHDINPKAPVHVLVIPKAAYTDMDDFSARASDAEISGFIRAVGKVAEMMGVDENGYRVISNCKNNGGQEVPHLHFHILGGKNIGAMVCD